MEKKKKNRLPSLYSETVFKLKMLDLFKHIKKLSTTLILID